MGFPKKISQLPLNLSLKPEDLLVTVNESDVTSKIKLEQLISFVTGGTNTFVTGGTYNDVTQNIDFSGSIGFPPFSVSLAGISTSDTFVTGATLNGFTLEIDRNNGEPQITVDLSPLTGDTDTFVTGFTYNSSNNTFSITNNDNDTFSAYIDAVSGLTINDYTLPLSDGEEYQVVRTDGNGNLIFDWADRAYLEVRVGEAMTKGDPVYVFRI